MTNDVFQAEVVIVGGTPGGIAAAIAAARTGRKVLLLDRTSHLGGLIANGLGATDIATRGATGGLFLKFVNCVERHYRETYGGESEQAKLCSGGYHFEPSVAEKVLQGMLAEFPDITVLLKRQFDALPENTVKEGARLTGIRVLNLVNSAMESIEGKVFIDATYEGDLAAAAGARYRVGREDQREFNEPVAGQIYKVWEGEIAPGTTGWGDNALQAYNYRLPLTSDPANRVPVEKPARYDRKEYTSLIGDLKEDRHAAVPGSTTHEWYWDGIGRVVNIVKVPNGKTDSNNQHRALISTDLPEENWPWPTANWVWRDAFAQRLREYIQGLLWFSQNDPELPEDFRARCLEWGFSKDEYQDNGYFPRQVYVREGRRIVGEYLFTAHDALPAAEGRRPPVHPESVTASHYALDSHPVRKREPGRRQLEGMLSKSTKPYTVPYGVMVPREVEGLLVPVAASATHIGFSTLRMEPCWMALGEAAGTAADLALRQNVSLRALEVRALQGELLAHGGVLLFFRDMGPEHEGYAALQFLGLKGILSDWEARPEEAITPEVFKSWTAALPVDPDFSWVEGLTRGEVLRKLSRKPASADQG